jgi:(p)ppGpp synthase/HD superfamily hydrolase
LPKPKDRLTRAFALAHQLHGRQKRKGTAIPYVSHLLAAASLVLENGGGEDEAIAALLHDAVEDQGGGPTLDKIRRKFGPRVARIVEGCTDSDVEPKPPWKARKIAYLAHLRTAPRRVQLVSAADKVHNARCILSDYRTHGEKLWRRFSAPKKDVFWYYRQLVKALRGAPKALVEELDRTVAEIARLTKENDARRARATR